MSGFMLSKRGIINRKAFFKREEVRTREVEQGGSG